MLKKFKLLFVLTPMMLASCGGSQTSSNQASNTSIPTISVNSSSNAVVDSSSEESSLKESSSVVVDPLADKEGLDLLYAIFETYKSRNSTIEQTGVVTEYFLGDAYYKEYAPEYLELYGAYVENHGFIVNPIQGIYEFVGVLINIFIIPSTDQISTEGWNNSAIDLDGHRFRSGECTIGDAGFDLDSLTNTIGVDGVLTSGSDNRFTLGDIISTFNNFKTISDFFGSVGIDSNHDTVTDILSVFFGLI